MFQVIFDLHNQKNIPLELEGIEASGTNYDNQNTKFDLSLFGIEINDSLILNFEYALDLFKAKTIENLAKHFISLLEIVVLVPDQKVQNHSLLTDREKQQVLIDWNQTTLDYSKDKTIHELFEEQVARTPNNIALVYEDK